MVKVTLKGGAQINFVHKDNYVFIISGGVGLSPNSIRHQLAKHLGLRSASLEIMRAMPV